MPPRLQRLLSGDELSYYYCRSCFDDGKPGDTAVAIGDSNAGSGGRIGGFQGSPVSVVVHSRFVNNGGESIDTRPPPPSRSSSFSRSCSNLDVAARPPPPRRRSTGSFHQPGSINYRRRDTHGGSGGTAVGKSSEGPPRKIRPPPPRTKKGALAHGGSSGSAASKTWPSPQAQGYGGTKTMATALYLTHPPPRRRGAIQGGALFPPPPPPVKVEEALPAKTIRLTIRRNPYDTALEDSTAGSKSGKSTRRSSASRNDSSASRKKSGNKSPRVSSATPPLRGDEKLIRPNAAPREEDREHFPPSRRSKMVSFAASNNVKRTTTSFNFSTNDIGTRDLPDPAKLLYVEAADVAAQKRAPAESALDGARRRTGLSPPTTTDTRPQTQKAVARRVKAGTHVTSPPPPSCPSDHGQPRGQNSPAVIAGASQSSSSWRGASPLMSTDIRAVVDHEVSKAYEALLAQSAADRRKEASNSANAARSLSQSCPPGALLGAKSSRDARATFRPRAITPPASLRVRSRSRSQGPPSPTLWKKDSTNGDAVHSLSLSCPPGALLVAPLSSRDGGGPSSSPPTRSNGSSNGSRATALSLLRPLSLKDAGSKKTLFPRDDRATYLPRTITLPPSSRGRSKSQDPPSAPRRKEDSANTDAAQSLNLSCPPGDLLTPAPSTWDGGNGSSTASSRIRRNGGSNGTWATTLSSLRQPSLNITDSNKKSFSRNDQATYKPQINALPPTLRGRARPNSQGPPSTPRYDGVQKTLDAIANSRVDSICNQVYNYLNELEAKTTEAPREREGRSQAGKSNCGSSIGSTIISSLGSDDSSFFNKVRNCLDELDANITKAAKEQEGSSLSSKGDGGSSISSISSSSRLGIVDGGMGKQVYIYPGQLNAKTTKAVKEREGPGPAGKDHSGSSSIITTISGSSSKLGINKGFGIFNQVYNELDVKTTKAVKEREDHSPTRKANGSISSSTSGSRLGSDGNGRRLRKLETNRSSRGQSRRPKSYHSPSSLEHPSARGTRETVPLLPGNSHTCTRNSSASPSRNAVMKRLDLSSLQNSSTSLSQYSAPLLLLSRSSSKYERKSFASSLSSITASESELSLSQHSSISSLHHSFPTRGRCRSTPRFPSTNAWLEHSENSIISPTLQPVATRGRSRSTPRLSLGRLVKRRPPFNFNPRHSSLASEVRSFQDPSSADGGASRGWRGHSSSLPRLAVRALNVDNEQSPSFPRSEGGDRSTHSEGGSNTKMGMACDVPFDPSIAERCKYWNYYLYVLEAKTAEIKARTEKRSSGINSNGSSTLGSDSGGGRLRKSDIDRSSPGRPRYFKASDLPS